MFEHSIEEIDPAILWTGTLSCITWSYSEW